jgi:hypothetical protein
VGVASDLDRGEKAVATIALLGSIVVLTLWPEAVSSKALIGPESAAEGRIVALRGRIVCLGEAATAVPCVASSPRFALQTPDGERHPFKTGDPLSAMFVDERLRERELSVRARKAPAGELETIKVHSVRNGRLHDLDYFCEVCNVVAYAPGLCPCCRRAMVLRETPLP